MIGHMESTIKDEMYLYRLTMMAVTMGASDIHLTPGMRPRFRVDGELCDIDSIPGLAESVKSDIVELPKGKLPVVTEEDTMSLVRLLKQNETELFEARKAFNFSRTIENTIRLRIHCMNTMGATAIVIRLVPVDVLDPSELNIPLVVRDFAKLRRGLILICGTQGQGKSTTMASLINTINTNYHKHIVTIEDPIEFIIESNKSKITQREIGIDSPSFGKALEDILREDADICIVGEVRSEHEMDTVLTLSEAGLLVFATIHSSGAVEAIERVVHMFKEEERARYRLASVLQGAVCQQLLKRKDQQGRVLASEVIVKSESLTNNIKEGKFTTLKQEFQGKLDKGNVSMEDSIKRLKDMGYIDV